MLSRWIVGGGVGARILLEGVGTGGGGGLYIAGL